MTGAVPAEDREARVCWARLAEPGDETAGALVAVLGAAPALEFVCGGHRPGAALQAAVGGELEAHGARPRDLSAGLRRWAPRIPELDAGRDLRAAERCRARVLVPGDDQWPDRMADLGCAAPLALWVRGRLDPAAIGRSVSLVGSRAASEYGAYLARRLAAELTDRRFAVVSGGAFGVDAAAHRGALAAGGTTVAFMAGGVDRLYPAAHDGLLRAVGDSGALVAEVPPGQPPTKWRFLQRNRLIAALSAATVVVEAALRSGALNTAGHAARLLRPVGAVPGPVTSGHSAGCHRLLRDGQAQCVTSAGEIAELAGAMGEDLAEEPARPAADYDGVTPQELAVLDALPLGRGTGSHGGSRGRGLDAVARRAGLGTAETQSALGRLSLLGLVDRDDAGWLRLRRLQ